MNNMSPRYSQHEHVDRTSNMPGNMLLDRASCCPGVNAALAFDRLTLKLIVVLLAYSPSPKFLLAVWFVVLIFDLVIISVNEVAEALWDPVCLSVSLSGSYSRTSQKVIDRFEINSVAKDQSVRFLGLIRIQINFSTFRSLRAKAFLYELIEIVADEYFVTFLEVYAYGWTTRFELSDCFLDVQFLDVLHSMQRYFYQVWGDRAWALWGFVT